MARTEVEKAARDWMDERSAGRTALEMDCRYMIVDFCLEAMDDSEGKLILCTSMV